MYSLLLLDLWDTENAQDDPGNYMAEQLPDWVSEWLHGAYGSLFLNMTTVTASLPIWTLHVPSRGKSPFPNSFESGLNLST